MIPVLYVPSRQSGIGLLFSRGFSGWLGKLLMPGALLLWLGLLVSPLAAATTNAAPASPAPPAASGDGFGQYVVDHQSDLEPFFSNHKGELVKDAIPLMVSMATRIMLWTFIVGWIIDVFLSRGFSSFFAPAHAKFKRASVYATGQLVICLLFSAAFSLVVVFGTGIPYFEIIMPIVGAILFLAAFVIEVGWVIYLYQTKLPPSLGFYLVVFAVHSVTAILVATPLLGGKASDLVTTFVDQDITTKLRVEIGAAKHELDDAAAARDKVKAESDDAQNRLATAQTQQVDLQKQIEQKKNSEAYLFSQIAKVHARGDLKAAQDQYTDFLSKFPSGAFASAARTQLDLVNNEMTAQAAKKKQDDDDKVKADEAAKKDLLDRASKGQVSLSEMRQALMGKTLADVKALFGLPSDVASDRWGYAQRMVYDPLKDEKNGLTVYFSQGVVQGVDYYYGVRR
jgi:DNA-binding transcriptional regulator YdaS (Cro superfamily)